MPASKRITVPEAVTLAKREYGIFLSRPTVIKYAKEKGYGYQLGGAGGKWVILKDQFRRFCRGSNQSTEEVADRSDS